MGKYISFFLFLVCFPILLHAKSSFVIVKDGSTAIEKIAVNKLIDRSTAISPFINTNDITGLSIKAEIRRTSPDYFVRVILKDSNGIEYLVMESYREIYDKDVLTLSDYGEETVLLDDIIPESIKVYLWNATLYLSDLTVCYQQNPSNIIFHQPQIDIKSQKREIRKNQIEEIVEKINAYNTRQGKIWIAGVTELSLMDYETKKRVLGMEDDSFTRGFEYYVGGVFEVGNLEVSGNYGNSSSFVSEFDWRNRHGKDWTTSVKDQGASGFCAAFTTCSTVESSLNLYLNNLVNLDLSEQEAACCNGSSGVYFNGMTIAAPLIYCKNHGICDEMAYPFVDDPIESTFCRSDEIEPSEIVQISQYIGVSSSTDSILKRALIKYGPLASGFKTSPSPGYSRISHAMSLIGFKEVHLGDTIDYVRYPSGQNQYTGLDGGYVVGERERDSLIIGKTIWIFKNSYASSPYCYMVFDKQSDIHYSYAIKPQLSWIKKDNNGTYTDMVNIICEDADGDGYYFWGLGTKPASCPSWVPDEPDGDDHSYQYGPIDEFGNLKDLSLYVSDEIVIDDNVVYDARKYVYNNIRIVNGGTLTIENLVNLYDNCIIFVENGGQLIIDGGSLQNACLQLGNGSIFTIRNGGGVKMRSNCNFDAPQGVVINIEHGSLN